MKLKLNKKKLKNLSNDNKALPMNMTPKIGGARGPESEAFCQNTNDYWCQRPTSPLVTCSNADLCV
ncbi:hypothetical protein [Pseudoalteromonas denitrificans]|uniref:Uncharacterized protein n=1 Tax=Pseudoalteromonas denitrificans DSM 6059 TaxID=1123010 RepID=A0A1I1SQX7_9GAMM|nr:hypothetical protein [Pseudoalteromonas denitrificans]SFD48722.1 hypothetical protein SAMN02745724_04654 [Pseudoalteromonas denitrificans DSM 6059]